MTSPLSSPKKTGVLRFGLFEVDLQAGELRKNGVRLRIQEQPLQILILLAERHGSLVTREELRDQLWPTATFGDFNHGLNNAVNRLREVLGDSAESPRFVETLPRRGYRLIVPVEQNGLSGAGAISSPELEPTHPPASLHPEPLATSQPASNRPFRVIALTIGLFCTVALLALLIWFTGLRHRAPGPATTSIKSVAVLPLENFSGDASDDYFADGMTDELITDLAKIDTIRVISRTSAMHYKGTKRRLSDIGRELNVDAVAEGSVLRSGKRVRITAQLVYVPTDQHLWANSYERDIDDVLALQSEVARDIAQQIQAKLTPQQQVRVATVSRCRPQAHDLVLQGLYYWFKATPDDYEKTRTYGEQAVAADPECAGAHEILAFYYSITADEGLQAPKQAWEGTRAEAAKALILDETLSGAHVGMGAISLLYEWNWNQAENEFRRALELNPSSSDAHREYALYLRTMGRTTEAIAEVRRAQELDPLSVSISASLGWTLYYAHRWDEAIAQFQKTLGMDSEFLAAHEGLAKCYEQKEMDREAADELLSEMMLAGRTDVATSFRRTYARFGYRTAVHKLYELKLQEFREAAHHDYVSPFIFADLYALWGDREQAFVWLERAFKERSSKLVDLKLDPDFDSIRDDPRFENLMRRIGLP